VSTAHQHRGQPPDEPDRPEPGAGAGAWRKVARAPRAGVQHLPRRGRREGQHRQELGLVRPP
jgi:hypothetical protein